MCAQTLLRAPIILKIIHFYPMKCCSLEYSTPVYNKTATWPPSIVKSSINHHMVCFQPHHGGTHGILQNRSMKFFLHISMFSITWYSFKKKKMAGTGGTKF